MSANQIEYEKELLSASSKLTWIGESGFVTKPVISITTTNPIFFS